MKQKTKAYPLFPEKTKEDIDQFTDYQNENKKIGRKPNEKLMIKLTDKEDYVIDGEMLEWYLDNDLTAGEISVCEIIQYTLDLDLTQVISIQFI